MVCDQLSTVLSGGCLLVCLLLLHGVDSVRASPSAEKMPRIAVRRDRFDQFTTLLGVNP